MEIAPAVPHLDEALDATSRYLESLGELSDDDLREPSLLPGWSRAHVATHLARNADAMTNVIHSVINGREAWMYSSQEQRDADVVAGAQRTAAEILEDNSAACGRLLQAFNELHPRHLDVPASREPGGPPAFIVRELGSMRLTEVVVHHTDLGYDLTPGGWPHGFAEHLIRRRQRELAAGPSMVLSSSESAEIWKFGQGSGPEITGTPGELAWWLIGRGDGSALHCAGTLPRLERWR